MSENKTEENAAQEKDSSVKKVLELGGRKIILIGTAHVSADSIKDVKEAINESRPDTVAIELDQKRLESLEDPDSWRKMDVVKVLRNKQGFLMLANIVLASYQKRMGKNAGVKPGQEMVAALECAKELSIPTVMVDRPIAVTLRRAWMKNNFCQAWAKL